MFDARESYPLLSSQLLAMYRELYDLEDLARDMTDEQRQQLPDREARPVWQRMREVLDGQAASQVLPKDKFAEALVHPSSSEAFGFLQDFGVLYSKWNFVDRCYLLHCWVSG